jgi:hypothetical protein
MFFLYSPNFCSPSQETTRIWSQGGFGRTGPGGGRSGIYGATGFAQYTFPANITGTGETSILTTGFAWQVPLTWAGITSICQFHNQITGLTFSLAPVGDGRFWMFADLFGSRNVSAPSGPFPTVTPGQWVFVEVQVISTAIFTPANPPVTTEGNMIVQCEYTLKLNEVTDMFGILDTPPLPTNNPSIAHFNFASASWGGGGALDDLYIMDSSDFLGDGSNNIIYPANDVETGWTPSGGTTLWQMIDDKYSPGADDDGSYVAASASALKFSCQLQTLAPFTGAITGAQAMMLVRKTDAGSALVTLEYNEGAYATSPVAPNQTYTYIIDGQRNNPITNTAWNITSINSLDLGGNRVA